MVLMNRLVTDRVRSEGRATTRRLSFEREVPRDLVHKNALSEVLLTDAARTAADEYRVAAKWPRGHVLFGSGPRRSLDPLLLVETVRQAGLYLSHLHYEVPRNHPFVLSSLDYEVETRHAALDAGRTARSVVADITCHVEVSRSDYLSMSLDAVVRTQDEVPLGKVGFCWQSLSPERYDRLRFPAGQRTGGRTADNVPAPAQSPAAVGRAHPRDVLLSPRGGPRDWRLRLDPSHPVYFDHACDHIPGMALLESFHQSTWLMSAHAEGVDPENWLWCPTAAALTFQSFGDLDMPTAIRAEQAHEPGLTGQHAVRVSATQGDTVLATAALLGSGIAIAGGGML